MPVVLRLRRTGRKNVPSFRLVVADKRMPRNGRFIEELGFYDPHGKSDVRVNEDKVLKWLRSGAEPSDTVKSLLVKTGIWSKFLEKK